MAEGVFKKIFSNREFLNYEALGADMHSHFIPGIDDGSASVEESIEMLQELMRMGYRKFITTPHIQPEFFPNTEDIIRQKTTELKAELEKRNFKCDLIAAAEYYVDENFLSSIGNRRLLTFGEQYVLIEVSMMAKSGDLEKVIFELILQGYKVVLAHVERYPYMYENRLDYYASLKDKDVLLQVNLRSFIGQYGEIQKKIARELAEKNMIDMLGTDMHKPLQLKMLSDAMHDEHVQKLLRENKLLNKTL